MFKNSRIGFGIALAIFCQGVVAAEASPDFSWSTDTQKLVVGDFNGDGHPDVLLQSLLEAKLDALALGPIDLTTSKAGQPLLTLEAEQALRHPSHDTVLAGDIDGDGRDDLLIIPDNYVGLKTLPGNPAYSSDAPVILYGDAAHPLEARQAMVVGAQNQDAILHSGEYVHLFLDMNGDGRKDWLAQPKESGGKMWVAFGQADGSFAWSTVPAVHPAFKGDLSDQNYKAIVGDFTGDGKDDVFMQSRNPDGDSYLLKSYGRLLADGSARLPAHQAQKSWDTASATLFAAKAADGSVQLRSANLGYTTTDISLLNAGLDPLNTEIAPVLGGSIGDPSAPPVSCFSYPIELDAATNTFLPKEPTVTDPCSEPAPPTNFTGTTTSTNGNVQLNWTLSQGATSYRLKEYKGLNLLTSLSYSGTTSSATRTLTNGTYTYYLSACNRYGCSSEVSHTVTVALPTGVLTTSPNPCSLTKDRICTTRMQWSTTSAPNACLFVLAAGDPTPHLVSCTAQQAGLNIPWISEAGADFYLRENNSWSSSLLTPALNVKGRWTIPPTPSAPTFSNVENASSLIDTNGNYTVNWSGGANALRFELYQGLKIYDGGNTSLTVAPTSDGSFSYSVKACNNAGCSAASPNAVINVKRLQLTEFKATPNAIQAGQSSSLSWKTTNASACSINNNVGAASPTTSGSVSISPTGTTTYTLTCDDLGGSNKASSSLQTTVSVSAASPVAISSFTASPNAVTAGSSTSLRWSTSNATSCSINQGIGAVTPVNSGSRSVSPSSSITYTLTCQGSGGPVSKSATVTVSSVVAISRFVADPVTITSGGSSSLQWTTSNATSCSIDQGVGAATPVASGSHSVSPTATTTYTLSCQGGGGPVTRTVKVTVSSSSEVWKDLGQCDERTGKKLQICSSGSCTVGSTHLVSCTTPSGSCD